MKKFFAASAMTILAVSVFFVIVAAQEIELIDTAGAWRLPFDGTTQITNGPLEGLHTGRSAEAIDYLHPNAVSYQVLAPANGTVTNVFAPGVTDGFGWLVRINHNGTTSFFAHLDGNAISVSQGQNVKQGDLIAMTGNSGNGASFHLHFEARTAVAQNTVNSGNASPIRAIPGNWWNTWYSPPPNFQHDTAQSSGGAKYPEGKKRPNTTSPQARHLSNQQSPPNVPAGWMSNISTSAVTLHFGAAPDTPNTNYATTFNVYEFRQSCNCWSAIPGGPAITGPWYSVSIGSFNQSESNGQHAFNASDENEIPLTSGDILRYWEVWPGNSTSDTPHLIATYRNTTTPTTLEFCTDADKYTVYEDHGNGSQVAFTGPGCSIQVNRQVGGINRYAVRARVGGIWTPVSPWLIIHD